MASVDNAADLLKRDYRFKGSLTENFVLQQLRSQFRVERIKALPASMRKSKTAS